MVISITRILGQDIYFCSPRCEIWYQRVVETSTTESKQRSMIEAGAIMQDNTSAAPHSQKRQRNREEEFDEVPANFRRVRLRYSDQTQEPGSSQAAQETDTSPHGDIKPDRYDRIVFGFPPAENDKHDRSSFFSSDLHLAEAHAATAQLPNSSMPVLPPPTMHEVTAVRAQLPAEVKGVSDERLRLMISNKRQQAYMKVMQGQSNLTLQQQQLRQNH